jgi:small subunit ribosomal protein S19
MGTVAKRELRIGIPLAENGLREYKFCFRIEDAMSRSLKKGPYVDERLLAKVERQQRTGSREPIKTWSRDCTVVPDFIGFNFLVHNGRQFIKLFVTEDMVGHKLGEFAPTRLFRGHSGGKAKAAAAAAAK